MLNEKCVEKAKRYSNEKKDFLWKQTDWVSILKKKNSTQNFNYFNY